MAKTTELEAAYRATTYRIFLSGGYADLRIGEANETLNAWLENNGVSMYAIITAFNPGSQPAGAAKNAEQQSQLECDLLEGHYEPYAGENIPDDENVLLEESCFVPDITQEDACALAEDFRQNAIVCGGADGVPKLIWIEKTE